MRLSTYTRKAVFALCAMSVASQAQAAVFFGVTDSSQLVSFTSLDPGTVSNIGAITGLSSGETIVGIDFRPAGGTLFGLGSGSNLYQINTSTGAATQVGMNGAFTLNGGSFGFDFNPTVDRIRVVSDTDQNLRLNPNNGALGATDTNLNPSSDVVGSAYTNSFAGATVTTLYGLDFSMGSLVLQGGVDGPPSPNAGGITQVGSLGVSFTSSVGFDISGPDAYASLNTTSPSTGLYRIDLNTGAASLLGDIGADGRLVALAAAPVPEPSTIALLALGLGAVAMKKLRRK